MKKEIIDDLPLWSAPFGLALLETIRLRKGISILDIGSGSGFPMIELAERFGDTCQVFGIDPSESSFEAITEKIGLKGITNAEIIRGVAEDLPFKDKTFGLIVSNNGLNNVADAGKVLSECFRIADAGCQVVLTMNLPHTMIEFYEIFEEVLSEKNMSDEIRRMKDHITQKRKSIEWWSEAIAGAGFSVSSVNLDGFKMHYADGHTFLSHSLIAGAFRPSWEAILAMEERSEIFDLILERLNQQALEQKRLIMSVPFVCFDCEKLS